MKELFNPKFVHFMWNDELEGKKAFLADTIDDLKKLVNEEIEYNDDCDIGCIGEIQHNVDKFPFKIKNKEVSWIFAYYDPNYDLKRACLEGETIQYRRLPDDNIIPNKEWKDIYSVSDISTFDDDSIYEYRIKPKTKFVPFTTIQELIDVWNKKITDFYVNYYKGEKACIADNPLIMPVIWIRNKNTKIKSMITDFDEYYNIIFIGDDNIYKLDSLFDNFEFLDGSVIGKKE